MNWIISYPRSGNTAARFLIELLTGKPTNGLCPGASPNAKDVLQQPLIHKGRTDYIFHKSHAWDAKPGDFVLFIIRDPLEACVRHNEGPRGIKELQMRGYLTGWFSLLQQYHDHPGPKALIYYEELIKIAEKESLSLYPNPQSRGPEYHRAKLGKDVVERLEDWMMSEFTELYRIYLG